MLIKKFQLGEKVFDDIVGGLFFARNIDSDRTFYIKILNENYSNQDDLVQAFHRGAEIACSLDNINTIRALEHGDDNGQHYIIFDLEYFNLISFQEVLHKKNILSIDEAISVIQNIAQVLRNAHLRGIIHANLTPHSIFLDKNLQSVRISDFGFGDFMQLLIRRQDPKILNLLPYYSPEFINNQKIFDGRIDIYSLGILFYRCLVGSLPWSGRNFNDYFDHINKGSIIPPSLQRLEIPNILDDLILETLEPQIENRCSNLDVFLQKLSQLKSLILVDQSSSIEQHKQNIDKYPTTGHQNLSKTQKRLKSKNKKNWFNLIPFAILILFAFFILFIINFKESFSHKKLLRIFQHKIVPSLIDSVNQKNLRRSEDWAKNLEQENDSLKTTSKINGISDNFIRSDDLAEKFNQEDDTPKVTKINGTISNVKTYSNINILTRTNNSLENSSQDNYSTEIAQIESLESAIETKHKIENIQILNKFEKLNQFGSVNLELWVRSGHTPLQAQVYIDGNFFGKTNYSGKIKISEIQLGRPYIIRIEKNGFEMWAKEVTFTKPGFESLHVELHASLTYPIASQQTESNLNVGVLTVLQSNQPYLVNAFVYINGKLWQGAQNSIPLRIELPVGEYNVKVKKAGFISEPHSHYIRINKGQDKTIYFNLIPE